MSQPSTTVRLQKFLANSGIASRRHSELLIQHGLIKVNGQVITEMGTKVDPAKDVVEYQNKVVALPTDNFIYYALNKPVGYTSTAADPHADHTILELVPPDPQVFPVGRLDEDTTGLLILTNDGDFAFELTHPKFVHEKEYQIRAGQSAKKLSSAEISQNLQRLEQGIDLEDGPTAPAKISQVNISPDKIGFNITIHEGKKRQIRRMVEKIGLQVESLCRVRIGKLQLGQIPSGQYRLISRSDVI